MVNGQSVHFAAAERVFGPPGSTAVQAVYDKLALLAFTNRSGSNLLAEYLQKSRAFSMARELLNPDVLENRSRRRGISTMHDYVADLIAQTNTRARIFALKASADQIRVLEQYGVLDMFREVRVIHAYRNDIVAQAVSFSIAFQTKQWLASHDQVAAAVYDFEDIRLRMEAILDENQEIFRVCSLNRLPKTDVLYEELEVHPRRSLERVFEHFGLDSRKVRIVAPKLQKQRTDANAEFAEKFRAEIAS